MDTFDIPIFKKTYDLYKQFHSYRSLVPKQDRYTIFERCENLILDVLACVLQASAQSKSDKLPTLENCSVKLNMIRVFIRLIKDTKAIDTKKYVALEQTIDEIGRMLGGWIKSTKC